MASSADGVLSKLGQFGQGSRASKFINKGAKAPAADAAVDGFFSKALNSAKETSVGTKLTANTGYKIRKETLSEESMEALTENRAAMKKKAEDISKKLTEATDDVSRKPLQKQLDAVNERTSRMDQMLKDGSFERESTFREYASDYFGDEVYGDFRKKAAYGTGAAVGAGMLVGRFATGGSLTRNGDGDRDIVGIPLI